MEATQCITCLKDMFPRSSQTCHECYVNYYDSVTMARKVFPNFNECFELNSYDQE